MEKEEKKLEEEEKVDLAKIEKDETAIQLQQTEKAIEQGRSVIEFFDTVMEDDTKRQKATVGAGSVVGVVANLGLDLKEETDEKKKEKLLEIGTTSVLEMSHGFVSVLLAGARRRRERKNAGKVEGNVKVVEEKK